MIAQLLDNPSFQIDPRLVLLLLIDFALIDLPLSLIALACDLE